MRATKISLLTAAVAALMALHLISASAAQADPGLGLMTVTPAAGVAGLYPIVSSETACPTAGGTDPMVSVTSEVGLELGGFPWAAVSSPTRPDGTWSQILPHTLTQSPGSYAISAQCLLTVGGQTLVTQTYQGITYSITAPGTPPQVSPATVPTGGHATVRSPYPCPAGTQARVNVVNVGTGIGGESVFFTTSTLADGSWTIDILAEPTVLPPGTYRAVVWCEPPGDMGQGDNPAFVELWYPDSATFTVTSAAARREYVAMGDSYSSGEGNAPWDPGTNIWRADMCHRSAAAWPRLLLVPASRHIACSGAVLANITTHAQAHRAPDNRTQLAQLAALRRTSLSGGGDIGTITLTITGNDVGFATVLRTCYLANCLAHPERLNQVVADLATPLTQTLRRIRATAPNAQVYLVGYPRLFPVKQSANVSCGWLSRNERVRANTLATNLTLMQRRAAALAGVHFIDVTEALAGHELCTATPWIYPVAATGTGPLDPRQGHPLPAGQRAIASIVAAGTGLPN